MSLISRNNGKILIYYKPSTKYFRFFLLDILRTTTLLWQSKRFRGKINIQRPRAPHFVKAKFLELTKPYFPKINPELVNVCNLKNEKTKKEIDNPFQRIIAGELRDSFFNSKLIGFFHKNSISAERIFIATNLFKKNGMILKTYGKTTLEMAVSGTQFDTVLQFYCSQNMIMLSPEPDIKKMFTIAKKFPELIFLGIKIPFLSRMYCILKKSLF